MEDKKGLDPGLGKGLNRHLLPSLQEIGIELQPSLSSTPGLGSGVGYLLHPSPPPLPPPPPLAPFDAYFNPISLLGHRREDGCHHVDSLAPAFAGDQWVIRPHGMADIPYAVLGTLSLSPCGLLPFSSRPLYWQLLYRHQLEAERAWLV